MERPACVGGKTNRVAGAAMLLVLGTAPAAHAGVFTVGGEASCSHASLQSAINAAQEAPGADEIHLARSGSYTAQALTIDTNQQLLIDGGYATCTSPLDLSKTVVSGAGGAEAEVFRVQAGTVGLVQFQRLQISGGDNNGSDGGGGIAFTGDGILQLANTTIINNVAGNGGGIYARGTGSHTELVLGEKVLIANNTARFNGGGLYVQGLEMTMAAPGSLVAYNEATGTVVSGQWTGGYGGGIYFNATDRPTYAMLGSSGGGSLGSIYSNTARHGGGMALNSSQDDESSVLITMFSTNASTPNGIVGNFAYERGGGVYMQPYSFQSARSSTSLTLWTSNIMDNAAPAGAAAFLNSDSSVFNVGSALGGELRMNNSNLGAAPPGAMPCIRGVFCGEIADNIASDENGTRTAGDVIQSGSEGGNVLLTRVHVHGNHGRRLIDSGDGGRFSENVALRSVLIDGNSSAQELIQASDGKTVILGSTIAGNTVGGDAVLRVDGPIEIKTSILWQPGVDSLLLGGGALDIAHVIASEVQSLGDGPAAIRAEPRFIDPERGDFGLRAASHAVDFAPAVGVGDHDLVGHLRDVDLAIKANYAGPRDLGALERPLEQPLVLNSDFDLDAHQWMLLDPGATVSSENGSGPAGSHSLHVEAAATRVVGAAQCIHVPGPGRYALNGFARGVVSNMLRADSMRLAWELRYDGDEACTVGAPNASGEFGITSGTAWVRAVYPGIIDVPVPAWTHETSITVYPVIVDLAITAPAAVDGYFDGITLEVQSVGTHLFSDGFESAP